MYYQGNSIEFNQYIFLHRMPWQGDINNMIDRFDVRAHLDIIPEVKAPYVPPEELNQEERQCNYERYRILAQNAFLGISNAYFLFIKPLRRIIFKKYPTLLRSISYKNSSIV